MAHDQNSLGPAREWPETDTGMARYRHGSGPVLAQVWPGTSTGMAQCVPFPQDPRMAGLEGAAVIIQPNAPMRAGEWQLRLRWVRRGSALGSPSSRHLGDTAGNHMEWDCVQVEYLEYPQ